MSNHLHDHITHPRHAGLLTAPSVDHTCANPTCGDAIRLTLGIQGEALADIGWTAQGCTLSQAGASIVSEMALGASVDAALAISPHDVLDVIGAPISPARVTCALLALRGLHEALTIWQMRE